MRTGEIVDNKMDAETERALLIAQRDDLLAALQACLDNDREGVFLDHDVLQQAKAAVAKARGQS